MLTSFDGKAQREAALKRELEKSLRGEEFATHIKFSCLEPGNSIDLAQMWLQDAPLALKVQHYGAGFTLTHFCYGCGRSLLFRETQAGHLADCSHCGPKQVYFNSLLLQEGKFSRAKELLAQELAQAKDPLQAQLQASELVDFLLAWRAAYWRLQEGATDG